MMPTPRYLASASASSTGEFLRRPRRPAWARWPGITKRAGVKIPALLFLLIKGETIGLPGPPRTILHPGKGRIPAPRAAYIPGVEGDSNQKGLLTVLWGQDKILPNMEVLGMRALGRIAGKLGGPTTKVLLASAPSSQGPPLPLQAPPETPQPICAAVVLN